MDSPSDATNAADPAPGGRGLRFLFGSCVLDTGTLELSVDGAATKLERKPLEVLMFLLSHAGELVTKDELLDEVWQGRVLSESVLTKCIAKLRQGLGDHDQALIKTVHGFGYRLLADVQVERPSTAPIRQLPDLKAGDAPPLRPLWRLERALGSGSFGDAWLVTHSKTHERRVFKFGVDAAGIGALRREITLHRVLRKALGPRKDLLRIIDWNLEEPPCYLEVEYVEGGSLTEWIESIGGLGTQPVELRIDLIAQTAEALAAAHSVGVLHKDLKPANVLVATQDDARPQVCLADFGSGHLTDLAYLEALEITRLGFTLLKDDETSGGTPLYLAPELLHGHAPTARSDIFALGVMLYQVVVGDLRKPLAVGWEQDIEDPLLREDIAAAADGRPEHRLGDAAVLARRLRTLATRREERAAEIAARDEQLRLQGALIKAKSRRRRLWFASGVLAAMLSIVLVLLLQVREAQEQARYEADVAAAVNEFLTNDLLGQANPMVAGRRDVTVREVLDSAAASLGRRFEGREGPEAGIRLALGNAYRNLGDYPDAERELELALALAERHARSPIIAGNARLERGRLSVSLDQSAEAIETVAPLLDSSEPTLRLPALILTAWARQQYGDYDSALSGLQAVLPEVEAFYGASSPQAASTTGYLATTLEKMGRYDEALEMHRRSVAAMQAHYGVGHVQTITVLRGLGASLFMVGLFDEAIEHISAAHAVAMEVLGDTHDDTLRIASDLGLLYAETGDRERGEQMMLATLETRMAAFGEASRDTRTLLNNLGVFYGEQGDHAREIDYLSRAFQAELAASGERDPATLVSAHNMARAMAKVGRLEEAETLERHTLEIAREALGPQHTYVGIMSYTLADILGRRGKLEEAEAYFEAGIALLDEALGPNNYYSTRANAQREEVRRLANSDAEVL
jgi:non-specific serine/threonine protein kinase